MAGEALLVLSTFPDVETARRIAGELLDAHLIACANLAPAVESIYRWEGKIETASETLAFFKTTADRFSELEAKLRAAHPYDVPEIIALPIAHGLPAYLRWVAQSCALES